MAATVSACVAFVGYKDKNRAIMLAGLVIPVTLVLLVGAFLALDLTINLWCRPPDCAAP